MRGLRGRASILASLALIWQIFAVMLVPTAACCQPDSASSAGGGMANCPMHHSMQAADCPMHTHASQADQDCKCPRLGCAPGGDGFMALMGPIGVLPTTMMSSAIQPIGDAVIPTHPSSISLASVPAAPPPRA